MKFLKGSLKLEPEKQPKSDEHREALLARQWKLDLVSGLIFCVGGALRILWQVTSISQFEWVESVLAAIVITVLAGTLLYSHEIYKYNLKPRDEYESSILSSANARAYAVLYIALIILVSWREAAEYLSWEGSLLLILGVAQLVRVRALKDPDASAQP